MRISPPHEAVIVALPTGAWLAQSDASLGGTLAPAAGAALLALALAWIMFSPPRPKTKTEQPAGRGCSEQRHDTEEHRISRTPRGRGARDVRCPASRARTRARRSSRR